MSDNPWADWPEGQLVQTPGGYTGTVARVCEKGWIWVDREDLPFTIPYDPPELLPVID